MGAQFDTGHDAHAECFAGGGGFIETIDGVVIRDGNGRQLRIMRGLHHHGRCQRPIRRRGVHLQIDKRWRRRRVSCLMFLLLGYDRYHDWGHGR